MEEARGIGSCSSAPAAITKGLLSPVSLTSLLPVTEEKHTSKQIHGRLERPRCLRIPAATIDRDGGGSVSVILDFRSKRGDRPEFKQNVRLLANGEIEAIMDGE